MNVKRWPRKIYNLLTVDTYWRSLGLAVGIFMVVLLLVFAIYGVVLGAATAIDGASVEKPVSEVANVEIEMWENMSTGSALSRSVYGFIHWFATLGISIGIIGIRIGYAYPTLGYAMQYSGVVIYGGVALSILQGLRAAELLVREVLS